MTDEQFERFLLAVGKIISNGTVLARLDERTKGMEVAQTEIKQWMRDHEEKDDRRFNRVFSVVNKSMGGLAVLVAVIGIWIKYGGN